MVERSSASQVPFGCFRILITRMGASSSTRKFFLWGNFSNSIIFNLAILL